MVRDPSRADDSVLKHSNVLNSKPLETWIDILKGRTDLHRRPILGSRFLIGADSPCDLRLGGNIPPLHTVIRIDGTDAWIEALASSPKLCLNGVPVSGSDLHDGDLISIGPFSFAFGTAPAAQPQVINDPTGQSIEIASEGSIEQLTAEELVDQIHSEQKLIDKFEARRDLGARSLLNAIEERKQELAAGTAQTVNDAIAADDSRQQSELAVELKRSRHERDDSQLATEIGRVVSELELFRNELERRSQQMIQHEMKVTATADMLLGVQQQIIDHLERLTQRLATLPAFNSEPVRRSA